MTTLYPTPYGGWPHCCRLSNGQIELVITTDVGPRLIHFGFCDADNEFAVFPDELGLTGGSSWRSYGGHRLWHAPEQAGRTAFPDNAPVALEEEGECVRVISPPEEANGVQKEMDIYLHPQRNQVRILHRLRNISAWTIELAPWALSVMAPGGVAIVPLPPRGSHEENLTPTSSLAIWAYTDMADPRWVWGRSHVLLRQDPASATPQKIGFAAHRGWAAYARRGHLFVKTFVTQPQAAYPDRGSTLELFTDRRMLEVETLGPLAPLAPGTAVEHSETWYLLRPVPAPADESGVLAHILPALADLLPAT